MRLHRLQLSAFGPFADEIDVNLDVLGADGLFLLHGDTGAGKTTLLDAIAFGLFGRVPGARNDAKRLRCDRADAATRTFVRIEATLGGRRLEILRSPAYLRPKARGVGLTEEKAKVTLRWLDAPPDGARPDGLTRAEEVGQTVIDLLGMSADQFFQVVLLPQGDFARFLRSDTADREVLLERLFDTGRFGTVEEWFSTARRESGARLRDRKELIGRLEARVAEAAGAHIGAADETGRWLADLRDRLADVAAVAAENAAAARAVEVSCRRRLTTVRGYADRVDRFADLGSRRDELARTDAARQFWRIALAGYEDAQPVIAAAVAAGRLTQHTRELQDVVDRARSVAERLVAPDEDVPKTTQDLRSATAVTREQAGALVPVILQAREQQCDESALRTASAGCRKSQARLAVVDGMLVALPAELEALAATVQAAQAASSSLEALQARVAAARGVLEATRAEHVQYAAYEQAGLLAAVAVDAHQRAVDERQVLVQKRILGMAAELAGGLTAGSHCPVCGSCDHPHPATPEIDAVDPEQITCAESAERTAAATRQTSAALREKAAMSLAAARVSARGATEDEAAADLAAADRELRAHAGTAAQLDAARSALRSTQRRLANLSAEKHELTALTAVAAAQEELLTAAIAARAYRLSAAAAGYSDIPARRDHLLELAGALDDLALGSERLDAADLAQARSRTELADTIAASSFQDLAGARAACAIDAAGVRRRLRAAEDELTVVLAGLADPALVGLEHAVQPSVAAAESAAEGSRHAAEFALLAASSSRTRLEQVAVAAARLGSAWRDLEPVLAVDAELAALTDVVLGKGQNFRSMSLRTYVLAAKLAQVALSAGDRLSAMSGGRYTFVRSDEKESRGRSGGLGLDILDAFSGLVRPAKTLSGGESFLASLALALGLADVVAAEAGGRQLDTMFIDEGFGSLDADTLDMVMGTLDELRAGGRIVGLVSHVDELRQRIPSRLHVRRTAAGSELEMSSG